MKPDLQVTLNDAETGLQGFVVVDKLHYSGALGGTRMTSAVTLEEVAALAQQMTLKLALAEIPIGGAKAGIVCDLPLGEQRDLLLESFGRKVRPLLHGGIYLGTDLGVSQQDRGVFFEAADFSIHQTTHGQHLQCEWPDLWEYTRDLTGYGVAHGVLAAIEHLHLERPRIAIQGFGAVGGAVAEYLAQYGFRIVAVADRLGTLADPDGLPVQDLLRATNAQGIIDRDALPGSLQLDGSEDAWLDVDAEVLVLAASGNAIHRDNMHRVRARIVTEGANLACSPEAERELVAKGIVMLPGIVVNCGGASVTGLVLAGLAPVSSPPRTLSVWLHDTIRDRIRRNLETILHRFDTTSDKTMTELAHELALSKLREREQDFVLQRH